MALARYELTAVDEAGNLFPGAQVEVKREVPGQPLAVIYSDRDGVTPLANPFTVDPTTAVGAFHVAGGAYQVRVFHTPSGFERIMRYKGIGTGAERDLDVGFPQSPAVIQRRTCEHVDDHGAVGFTFEDIINAESFASIVDDTTAFMAAIEAAIDAGHRRVAWNRCHAVNIKLDSQANERYRGLELIAPGSQVWREPRVGYITPFDVNTPAMQFGDQADPGGGRFYGLVAHGLQFEDPWYDAGGVVRRGGKVGLKTVGFRECKLYNPAFGGLAEIGWHMLGGADGSFFNQVFGPRFSMEGPANAKSLLADQGASFVTTTWLFGASFDEPSGAASGHMAIHGIGDDVELGLVGGWAQLVSGTIKLEEVVSGDGAGILTAHDFTVEGSGPRVEVDLGVSGGGSFRSNAHDHLVGTWKFTNGLEIETTANGYTGGDAAGTLSGLAVERMPTLEAFTRRGAQRLLPDAAGAQWLLTQERTVWMDISQATVLEPAEIEPGQRYTLFVRALGADRAFSFDAGSGVTTYVSGFSGTVQAGTVTRFDCFAGQVPSGDLVLFAAATERFIGASESRLWKALASSAAGSNVNTAQPWFPSAGGVAVQAATSYRFRGRLHMTRAAGSTNHTTSLLFGGTASLTSIAYTAKVKTGDAAGLAADSQVESATAAATQVKAASTSTTEVISLLVEGIVRINAAGTFTPQFQYSAAPGGAPTIQPGTFFELEAIGANTSESAGAWS